MIRVADVCNGHAVICGETSDDDEGVGIMRGDCDNSLYGYNFAVLRHDVV